MAAVQLESSSASKMVKKRGSAAAGMDDLDRGSKHMKEDVLAKKKKGNIDGANAEAPKGKSAASANNAQQKPGSGLMDWDTNDMAELIDNIGELLPKVDNVKYSTQFEKIDWRKVRFGEYTVAECKEKWKQIITKVRRFRTLTELVTDAKEWVKHPWTTFNNPKSKNKHPDLPKKPLTPYFLYFLEKRQKYTNDHPGMSMTEAAKELAQKFAALGEKKKQKYKDSYKRENENYKMLMEKFREEHPEMFSEEHRAGNGRQPGVKYSGPQKPRTPSHLFLAEKMTRHTNLDPAEKKEYEDKYRHQWKGLSDSKRVKWIRKSMADEQRYALEMAQYAMDNPNVKLDPVKSVISKAEKELKERIEGKPEKPPNSGYSLYSKIMLKQLKDIPSKEKMAEISKRWKMLSEKEKQNYTKEAHEATERYQIDYASYVAKLPEDERKKLEEEKGSKGKKKQTASKGGSDDVGAENSKPKKPMSALFFYQQENLADYKKTYPDKSEQDLTRTMAREYGELSDKKKNFYKQMADSARQDTINSGFVKENTYKRKNKLFKGEPKKPPQSGYLLFTMDAIAKLDIEPKERMQEIAKRWKELKDSEREKYKKRATELTKKYVKDLAKFEANLTEEDRKLYQQFKGSNKKIAPGKKPSSSMKRIKVVATEVKKDSDDEGNDESDKGEESSNDSDSSDDDDDSSDDTDKSDSGSDSKSDTDSSNSDTDNTKSSRSSSNESDSDDSGSDSDSGSESDK